MSKRQPLDLLSPRCGSPESRMGSSAPIGLAAMSLRVCLVFAALINFRFGAAGTALAQTAPSAQSTVPAPNCEKPGDPPRLLSTGAGREDAERKRNNWLKSTKSYIECLKQFIDDEQAAVAPHIKATNAAAEEINKTIKTYNEQAEAARQ